MHARIRPWPRQHKENRLWGAPRLNFVQQIAFPVLTPHPGPLPVEGRGSRGARARYFAGGTAGSLFDLKRPSNQLFQNSSAAARSLSSGARFKPASGL